MKDSQILSSFQDLAPRDARPAPVMVFDACHVGVILRAVFFVEIVMSAGAMFAANSAFDWLMELAFLSAAALPGTLAWLVVACSLKTLLARLSPIGQQAFGMSLGALGGLYGCLLLSLVGAPEPVPWLASAFTGALLAMALVAALVLRAKARMPADTAARLAELQARIRPHFLFNTLNSAVALVRDDPARAESLLEDLSDLFRNALQERGESVSLAEEIDLARRYLQIEQVRFGDRLKVEWDLDQRADAARVPPMMLQPLVENAVKHGVEPSPDGARVRITTQRRGSTVVIRVTNTVPVAKGRPGHGVAQVNVRERLRLLHDMQAQFQTGLKDGIYQVRVEVPA